MPADFTSNLEQYFTFDEGTGITTTDTSGNGRNGTLTNGPVWTTGKLIGGLLFSAASLQYVATNYAGITGTAARTVAFWVKTTDTNAATTASPTVNWGSASAAGQWLIAIQNGVLWGRFVAVTASFGSGINDGNWHHIAMTMPASGLCNQINGYIDGVLQTGSYTSGTTAINTGTTATVNVGFQAANSAYFNGTLDDVRIYSRALSGTDITGLFNWSDPNLLLPARDLEYTNPKGKRYRNDVLNPSSTLNTNLFAPHPFNPIVRPALVTKRNIIKRSLALTDPQAQKLLQTTLRNQDTFFTGPGIGPDYDYPNPRRKPINRISNLGLYSTPLTLANSSSRGSSAMQTGGSFGSGILTGGGM